MNTTDLLTSTPKELPAVTKRRLSEFFTKAEIAELTARSDWRGAWAIVFNWSMVASAFALVAAWPNPLTVVLALIVLLVGGGIFLFTRDGGEPTDDRTTSEQATTEGGEETSEEAESGSDAD